MKYLVKGSSLDFKEKLLRYTKLTKPKTTMHAQLLSVVVLLGISAYLMFFSITSEQETTSKHMPSLEVLEHQKDDQISIALGGDLMLARYTEDASRNSPGFLLGDASKIFEQADLAMANLETPIIPADVELEEAPARNTLFRAEPQALDYLGSINMVNLANNHAANFGRVSVQHTTEHLQERDINYVGGGNNRQEAYDIHYQDFDGFVVSVVGFNDIGVPELAATDNSPGVASMDVNEALPIVQRAADNSDLTIVNMHWGVEYKTHPTSRQENLAEALASVGADVIVGHHPHVLQPVDMVNGALVFYSLGNLVSDQGWSDTKEAAVPVLVVDKNSKHTTLLIEPFRIREARPQHLAGGLGLYRHKLQYKLQRNSSIEFTKYKSILVADVPFD